MTADPRFFGDSVKWDTTGLDALLDHLTHMQMGMHTLRVLDLRHTGFDVLGAEVFDYANKMYIPTKLDDIIEMCRRKDVSVIYEQAADFERPP